MKSKKEENSNTLYLPLKACWYNAIRFGSKMEEYREITPYWMKRIFKCKCICNYEVINLWWCKSYCPLGRPLTPLPLRYVRFSYGYTRTTMTYAIDSIRIGRGRPEWGAPDHDVIIISLKVQCHGCK